MYSRLDPIFRNVFQTEATDTRLGIKQDDSQDDRQKGRDHDKEEDSGFGPDSMELSVTALTAFLQSLISSGSSENVNPEAPNTKTEQDRPEVTAASRAASAYQETSQRTGVGAIDPVAEYPGPSAKGVTLTEDEIKTISQLLAGLKNLQAKGITSVVIPQGGSLLESLKKEIADS